MSQHNFLLTYYFIISWNWGKISENQTKSEQEISKKE